MSTQSLPRVIKTFGEIFRVQFKNNWVREAVYRTNFLTMVMTDAVWIAIEFSLFSVIYANISSLPGWTKDQVYFFLGMFFSSDAIFTVFFQRNFWQFSDLVNKGELDILLTKPIPPLFLILTRWMNLTASFNFLMGILIMVKYAGPAGFEGGWKWLLVGLWLIVGVLTSVLIRFLFSIWVFWTERSWAINRLYFQFFSFATKPDGIYPKMIRYMILTTLPFAFIGSVPARALLHGLTGLEYLGIFVVISTFIVVNVSLWKTGLKRYQSASS